jgi:hypothetical protein
MPTNPNPNERHVLDAMRSIQTEGDRWQLAEALAAVIPTGSSGFESLVEKAAAEGIKTGLSLTSLRLYRDTANRWPTDMRVGGVTFSAHREAMVLEESHGMAEAARMLADLKRTKDAEGKPLTVKSVREAIAVKQGRQIPGAAAAAAAGQPTGKIADIIADLKAGGAELQAAIANDTPESDLDKLLAGLNKVLAHVDRLKIKHTRAAKAAATKAATPRTPASTTTPTTTPTPRKTTARKAGDLRRRG